MTRFGGNTHFDRLLERTVCPDNPEGIHYIGPLFINPYDGSWYVIKCAHCPQLIRDYKRELKLELWSLVQLFCK